MNQQTFAQMWDHMRHVNGIAMRVLAALPADKLDSRPIPNMRTPKELVAHLYDAVIKGTAEGIVRGEITSDEGAEKKLAAGMKSRDDMLAFARDRWNAADKAAAAVTDAHLAATVKTPWGMDFPGHVAIVILSDEFLHHRGQLYAYLRALGGEPPMMWDFEHNEPAFRPKATAQA